MSERARRIGGIAALAFWLAVTVAWWALALWPAPETAPEWLERARAVCFNAGDDGLPDASGWLLLIGQPLGVLAVLMVIWGGAVRSGLRALLGARSGRVAVATTLALVGTGLVGAGTRVVSASASAPALAAPLPDTYPRLDRPTPELQLVDQHGRLFDRARLRGRPALVTFAFGHCETVCPAVVRQALEAQARLREQGGPVPRVVVVTLDPWRDTPSRLHHLAMHWQAGEDVFVLSGEVDAVNGVLDAWNVARRRDPKTGDVAHPPLFYVVSADGRLAYASSGGAETLATLVERAGSAPGSDQEALVEEPVRSVPLA